jgi:hypothetical protein
LEVCSDHSFVKERDSNAKLRFKNNPIIIFFVNLHLFNSIRIINYPKQNQIQSNLQIKTILVNSSRNKPTYSKSISSLI